MGGPEPSLHRESTDSLMCECVHVNMCTCVNVCMYVHVHVYSVIFMSPHKSLILYWDHALYRPGRSILKLVQPMTGGGKRSPSALRKVCRDDTLISLPSSTCML